MAYFNPRMPRAPFFDSTGRRINEPAALVGASEFGTPTGYADSDDYRGTIASETLEHALIDGIPSDG